MRTLLLVLCLILSVSTIDAETSGNCTISPSSNDHSDGKLDFSWSRGDCAGQRRCHDGNSDMPWSRWNGISPGDLEHEGAAIDARLTDESGEMRCTGKVHDGELQGSFSFTANPVFARRMEAMGFDGQTPDRLRDYTFLDVTTTWVKELKDAHVTGMNAQNLMGLRALQVDAAYVRAMAADGYPELAADKLTSMKAVGVTPEKVQAVRAMGFSPSEEEIIQMSVFKIDAPFVQRMKARGFKNLTISQLVQIKVFKLDE